MGCWRWRGRGRGRRQRWCWRGWHGAEGELDQTVGGFFEEAGRGVDAAAVDGQGDFKADVLLCVGREVGVAARDASWVEREPALVAHGTEVSPALARHTMYTHPDDRVLPTRRTGDARVHGVGESESARARRVAPGHHLRLRRWGRERETSEEVGRVSAAETVAERRRAERDRDQHDDRSKEEETATPQDIQRRDGVEAHGTQRVACALGAAEHATTATPVGAAARGARAGRRMLHRQPGTHGGVGVPHQLVERVCAWLGMGRGMRRALHRDAPRAELESALGLQLAVSWRRRRRWWWQRWWLYPCLHFARDYATIRGHGRVRREPRSPQGQRVHRRHGSWCRSQQGVVMVGLTVIATVPLRVAGVA